MADPETLAALKRAYADTILNTTKEAAARVIVSEKKARKYQQELVTVKDEALHTLLRLKQMLDSRVKETEMISFKQQQKVDELEAQLGEAEDIVGELRMELRAVYDELKKLTNGQTHLNNDHEEESCWKNCDAAVSVVPEVSCSHESTEPLTFCIPIDQSGSVVANGIQVQSLSRISIINRCSYKDNKDQCHHTLPSILTKRREAEGCTQIIHGVDSSMANGNLSSSVEVKDGVHHKDSSLKSVETLEISCCADASDSVDSMVSSISSLKGFGTPVGLKTSPPGEHENNRKLVIGDSEARKEEKKSCENIEVSASPLFEEVPVLAINKNRCIKYTFQRKRKKEALSTLEGGESRNMKQKIGEKDMVICRDVNLSF